jgi:sugar/nucleoside kinase (ribokinase family)
MVNDMIAVVGAVAIDMIAVRERFLEGTSNPSDIRLGLGGAGYRIFSNLEAPRRFITALADDPISRWAREALEEDGDVALQIVKGRNASPPLHLALMESGSLKVAATDLRIVEQSLSLDFVTRQLGEPGQGDFLVLDASISPQLLSSLVSRYASRTRVVFEPVSVERALRHAASLRGLFLLTPTEEEIAALCADDVGRFAAERRIENILVTRGAAGVRLYSAAGAVDFPPAAVAPTQDATGAADLLLALLLSRLHEGAAIGDAVSSALLSVEERLQRGAV